MIAGGQRWDLITGDRVHVEVPHPERPRGPAPRGNLIVKVNYFNFERGVEPVGDGGSNGHRVLLAAEADRDDDVAVDEIQDVFSDAGPCGVHGGGHGDQENSFQFSISPAVAIQSAGERLRHGWRRGRLSRSDW